MSPTLEQLREAYAELKSYRAVERKFKMSKDLARKRLQSAGGKRRAPKAQFSVAPDPNPILLSDLMRRRITEYRRKAEAEAATKVTTIRMTEDKPVALGWFGDPHVDDDGTDLELLMRHAEVFNGETPGMLGVCIGDVWNNWIGSLQRLWAEQGTSAAEARALVEHFLGSVNWLAFVAGNHDCWQNLGFLEGLMQRSGGIFRPTRSRFDLLFPNGRRVAFYASHDFKGRSMYSPSFGPAKKAYSDRSAQVYVCGHLHDAAYQNGFYADGRMWHAIRMASYKKMDEYVKELDIETRPGFECPVSIIDPNASSELTLVNWEWDPEAARDRLNWMRRRCAAPARRKAA